MTHDVPARLARVFEGVFGSAVAGEIAAAPDVGHPAWDSIAQLNLVMAVEQEFAVRFSPEEAGMTTTFGALQEILELKLRSRT